MEDEPNEPREDESPFEIRPVFSEMEAEKETEAEAEEAADGEAAAADKREVRNFRFGAEAGTSAPACSRGAIAASPSPSSRRCCWSP